MNSRLLSATKAVFVPVILSVALPMAASAENPRYTFVGINYEWTDVKYAADPSSDPNFNNGDFEGVNFEGSVGLLSFLHLAGEYFTGDCNKCAASTPGTPDIDYDGFKLGAGLNFGLGLFGLGDNTDAILRASYLDVELDTQPKKIDDDGWSVEGLLRSQISDKTDVEFGYEWQDVGETENRNLLIGLNYEIWSGIALSARGIIFDDDTGFSLGARWFFGPDSIL